MAPSVRSRRFGHLCWLLFFSGLLGTTNGQEASGSGPCPDGYVLFENVCYRAYKEFKTFAQAVQWCEADGGTLAMPKDRSVDMFFTGLIIDLSPMTDAWIGLRNEGGTWTWMDEAGTTVSECGFSAWDEANTAHTDGNCGYIKFTSWYKWADSSCNTLKSGLICQIGQHESNCGSTDSCTDHPEGVTSGDTCYYVNTGSMQTYVGATDACDAAGASVAMPKNAGITFLLMGLVIKTSPSRSMDHWIGIDDMSEEGQEIYQDGLLIERCSYSNWLGGGSSDNEINKDCVVLKGSAWMDWSYLDCTRSVMYICQLGPGDNEGCILPTTIPPTTTALPTTTVPTTTVADPTTPAAVPSTHPRLDTTTSTVPQAPTTSQEDQTTTLPGDGQQGKQESGVDQGALAGGVAAGVVVAGVGIGIGVAAYKFKWLAKVSPK
ncbi:macrophage mannose receptor 1-like [Branchiostoma floridae]|uniref:Macrophage mannose receptor 1-like n=1 Tax=Branchiostoma floridae TaxID=7739 RepID=A0A9J7HVN0_BRAFL|nr:macrophage mannose receptor 1-like [Branchiostoma floridae]